VLHALGAEKGASSRDAAASDLPFAEVVKIARRKPTLTGTTLRSKVKEVLGTCLSMNVTVDGKNAKEVQRLVEEGAYEKLLQ
jgi:large subunit ribosomal protein L11